MRLRNRNVISAFALFLASFAAQAVRGDIINDGSFEQPDVSGAPGGVLNLPAGASFPTSSTQPWIVGSGANTTTGSIDVIYGGSYFTPAFDGHQVVDLDGLHPGSISQTFPTVAGQTYTLSFAYANNTDWRASMGYTPSAQVLLSDGTTNLINSTITHGTELTTWPFSTAQMNYVVFTQAFTATSNSETIRFISLDPADAAQGIILDAVSVAAVPEPGSMALFGLSVLGLGAYWRLRRRPA